MCYCTCVDVLLEGCRGVGGPGFETSIEAAMHTHEPRYFEHATLDRTSVISTSNMIKYMMGISTQGCHVHIFSSPLLPGQEQVPSTMVGGHAAVRSPSLLP